MRAVRNWPVAVTSLSPDPQGPAQIHLACKVCSMGQISDALYHVGGMYRRNM